MGNCIYSEQTLLENDIENLSIKSEYIFANANLLSHTDYNETLKQTMLEYTQSDVWNRYNTITKTLNDIMVNNVNQSLIYEMKRLRLLRAKIRVLIHS